MSVDLRTYIPDLQREVQAPGADLFPDATTADWLGNLVDGYWETVMDGIATTLPVTYTETDGVIDTSPTGGEDYPRDYIQIVLLYAGIRIVRNQLRALQINFRAKAGNVEYETSNSATMLRDILAELKNRRQVLLLRLSDVGSSNSYYTDAILAREEGIQFGDIGFTRFSVEWY